MMFIRRICASAGEVYVRSNAGIDKPVVVEREVVVGDSPVSRHALDHFLTNQFVARSLVDAQMPILVAGCKYGSRRKEVRNRRVVSRIELCGWVKLPWIENHSAFFGLCVKKGYTTAQITIEDWGLACCVRIHVPVCRVLSRVSGVVVDGHHLAWVIG